MLSWNQITVLSVDRLYTVPSEKGMHADIVRTSYGLSFSYGGRISYHLNGVQSVSDRTHAILLPKGSYHLFREETGDFPVINFTTDERFSCDRFLTVPLRNPDRYLKDYERMMALWLTGESPARLMSIFYGILAALSEEETEQVPAHTLLKPAMDYLATHLFDPCLSNDRLATEASISEVYFRRLFHQAYGISPRQYILDARINHAKHLLSEQAATVTLIAEACGFSSVYHFCRAFKAMTGQTPKEYVKNR